MEEKSDLSKNQAQDRIQFESVIEKLDQDEAREIEAKKKQTALRLKQKEERMEKIKILPIKLKRRLEQEKQNGPSHQRFNSLLNLKTYQFSDSRQGSPQNRKDSVLEIHESPSAAFSDICSNPFDRRVAMQGPKIRIRKNCPRWNLSYRKDELNMLRYSTTVQSAQEKNKIQGSEQKATRRYQSTATTVYNKRNQHSDIARLAWQQKCDTKLLYTKIWDHSQKQIQFDPIANSTVLKQQQKTSGNIHKSRQSLVFVDDCAAREPRAIKALEEDASSRFYKKNNPRLIKMKDRRSRVSFKRTRTSVIKNFHQMLHR